MKLVFLDRDGVINEFPGKGKYVTKLKEFHFIPGSLEALRTLTKEHFTVFIISNQAGVSKGVYTKEKLSHITRNMLDKIRQSGGRIKRVFYCTHRSDEGCDCRKPEIGSVRKAFETMNKSIRAAQKAFFVGDTESDILAGHKAGCKTIFVLSGHKDRRHMRAWAVRPDFIARNLLEAVTVINRNHAKPSKKLRKKKKS